MTAKSFGAGRFRLTGIKKKMFLTVSVACAAIIVLLTIVMTVVSSHFLMKGTKAQLESQANQVINVFDEKMASVSAATFAVYSNNSVKALMNGTYSGYQAYTTSRDSYNLVLDTAGMDPSMEIYVMIPSQDYVMGSKQGNVSSKFEISDASSTRVWFAEIRDAFTTSNYRADFVPPVTGGSECFAYILSLRASKTWEVRGFVAGTLEKSYLDEVIAGTLLSENGCLLIMGPDGSVAYVSNPSVLGKLKLGSDEIVARLDGRTGKESKEGRNLKGYYMVSKNSQYGGYRFIAMVGTRTIFADVLRLGVILVAGLLLALLLMLAAVFYISERITRPVLEITENMVAIEKDGYSGRLNVEAEDEILDLENAFNDLMVSLQENQIMRQKAQLDALQKQINPHFLFNTLETVKALAIRQDTPAVLSMVQSLADIFRYNTNRDNKSVTALKNEFNHVRNYLKIQKVRFGERLNYEVTLAPEAEECETLKFILQPVVENAVHYAMDRMDDGCRVCVDGSFDGTRVTIIVTDNGPGMDEETCRALNAYLCGEGEQGRFGIGLKNIYQRLRLYSSGEFDMRVESTVGEGTSVTIGFAVQEVSADV